MSVPQRIQLRRAKGWRMPDNTVSVARPGRWGNPYSADQFGAERCLRLFENTLNGYWAAGALFEDAEPDSLVRAAYKAHTKFRARHFNATPWFDELRGKNLACWCRLDQPCHADVLLRLANEGAV